jgi:hypothetical protein
MNRDETREIIKKWILGWIGNKPTYKITTAAEGWFKAGLFTEDDIIEIHNVIESHNAEVIEE